MSREQVRFPRRAIRDALGLCRLLWRSTSPRQESRRYALEQVGLALVAALHQPRHRDAHRLAVVALEHLEAIGGWGDGADELVTEATDRVRGRPRTEREEKEWRRARRG